MAQLNAAYVTFHIRMRPPLIIVAGQHKDVNVTFMFDLGMSMEKLVLQEQSKNPKDIKEDHVDLSVGIQLQPFHELLYLFMESWCSVDVTVTQAH